VSRAARAAARMVARSAGAGRREAMAARAQGVRSGDPGPLHPCKSPLYLAFPGEAGLQDVLFDNRV
jgi:hypothetical protein